MSAELNPGSLNNVREMSRNVRKCPVLSLHQSNLHKTKPKLRCNRANSLAVLNLSEPVSRAGAA